MVDSHYLLFVTVAALGASYFLLARRTLDLLAIAFSSALFYFLPMFFQILPILHGQGIVQGEWATIIPGSYVVATAVTMSLIAGAILKDRLIASGAIDVGALRSSPSLASYYVAASVLGLCIAIWSAPKAIFTTDKSVVLANIGYGYALFETAAGLAFIDAAIHRRRLHLVIAAALLFTNLLIGFRLMVLMVAIALIFVALASSGPVRVYRKLPAYGAIVFCLFMVLLFAHQVRFRLLGTSAEPMLAALIKRPEAPIVPAPPGASEEQHPGKFVWPSLPPILHRADGTPTLLFDTLVRMEPFTTQSILNEIVRHERTCSLGLGAGKLVLLLSPFGRLLEGRYSAFEDEFKSKLFPTVTFGLAANVWAEAYCRLGPAGVIAVILAFVTGLIVLDWMIRRLPGILAPPLLLAGALLAFYIHRNDLYYELLLLRRAALVFLVVWAVYMAVSWAKQRHAPSY
jgi:hypothetical protein